MHRLGAKHPGLLIKPFPSSLNLHPLQNPFPVPGIDIPTDHIRNIRFAPRPTKDKNRSLVVSFTDVAKATEALPHAFYWQGQHHDCEVINEAYLKNGVDDVEPTSTL